MPAAAESLLLQEIRQTKPFRTPSQEAAVALMRTADLIQRNYSRLVEPRGLTVQQYNVLRILRGAGQTGLPTLDIGERMIEQTPGITRLLDRLEAKKMVRRQRSTQDRRQVFCWITPAGLKLLAEIDAPIEQTGEAVFAKLDEAEIRALIAKLERLRQTLHTLLTAG
ncbi:MAG: MarR family transcriptional regulator [Bryobacteraceae bacterium]|nr:MarR family transcriptional regulator [Bryobacteraceae bacterium]